MRAICATHLLNLAELTEQWKVIAVSVGPHADPIVLAVEKLPDYRTVSPALAQWATEKTEHQLNLRAYASPQWKGNPNCLRIYHQLEDKLEIVTLSEVYENPLFVQPLGVDHWLLSRPQARDHTDANAYVYSSSAQRSTSFYIGDGIEDIQVTDDQQIWVSYFDEGVYGHQKFGASGVVCFDQQGQPTFLYSDLARQHGLPAIDDCYAMNVAAENEVWLYYYSAFPVVKLRNKRFDLLWKDVPMRGTHGFAITDYRALFSSGVGQRQSLFLLSLDTLQEEEILPVTDTGTPIRYTRAFGRGSRLYLETTRDLFVLDIKQIDDVRMTE